MPRVQPPRRAKTKAMKRIKKWVRRLRPRSKVVNSALTPIPQRFITKMKYTETVAMNSLNAYTYAFNLNSVFDPNRTGTGHQPYGHDTFATMYNRYRVIGCSYTIQGFNSTNTVVISANPANELVVFTNTDEAMENPRTKWITQTAGGGIKVLKGNVYIPSLVGRSKAQYMADDRYQAQTGTSPNELAILNLACQSISSGDVTVDCVVTLNYLVEWFDIKNLAQS